MKDAASNAGVDQVAAAVREYLALHPDAVDTVEGIATWWIPASNREAFAPQIGLALDLLVNQGVLARRVLPDGRSVYANATKTASRHVAVKPKR